MKYKVGDIIKVRSFNRYNESERGESVFRHNSVDMTEEMSEYCGKLAKIKKKFGLNYKFYYKLDIDHEKWDWQDWMFDDNVYEIPIRNLCNNFCYMECNKKCSLFKFIMKHKVGDTVKIKSLDWYNENKDKGGYVQAKVANSTCMVDNMSIYCGKLAKISEVRGFNNSYKLDIDHGEWNWEDWMFEGEEFINWNGIGVINYDLDDYNESIKNLCSKSCYMECNKNCPLFKFKELL